MVSNKSLEVRTELSKLLIKVFALIL